MAERSVAVQVPAKINLCLGVGGLRDDGFHSLATVYQAVGLVDEVTARPARGWSLAVAGDDRIPVDQVPLDETNIAVRAAMLLAEHHGRNPDVALEIHKGIPVAGGMAGGSADAAGALLACDLLWGTNTSRDALLELAGRLGSDVPFALVGGTAVGSGRGEIVAPVATHGVFWWVVLESHVGLSTPAVYREFDDLHAGTAVVDPVVPPALLEALDEHDLARLGTALTNDLQPAALRLRPELAQALDQGLAATAHGCLVSGSGPSLLFLCSDQEHAERVAAHLTPLHLGPVSCACGPAPGARVIG